MEDIIAAAKQYRVDAVYTSRAHYKAVDSANFKNKLLGIPVVITTTIVATSIFSTLNSSPGIIWQIVTGLLSILALVLSALQTFFRYSDLAEKYRTAAVNYSTLRREIEFFILKYGDLSNDERENALNGIDTICRRFSQLARDSIAIPPKAYDKAVKEIKSEKTGATPTSVGRIKQD